MTRHCTLPIVGKYHEYSLPDLREKVGHTAQPCPESTKTSIEYSKITGSQNMRSKPTSNSYSTDPQPPSRSARAYRSPTHGSTGHLKAWRTEDGSEPDPADPLFTKPIRQGPWRN